MFGTGLAAALDKWDIPRICVQHGWHPAALESIARVESGGFGWFRDGRCKMLPEPHIFLRQLKKYAPSLRQEAIRRGLATTTTFKKTRAAGHYRRMKGADPRYRLLAKWRKLHEEAALASASWGTYQIMGFNAKTCGWDKPSQMVQAFFTGEREQLKAFVNFLLKNRLKKAIQELNFARVEKVYNGGGLGGAYAKRMLSWYRKLSRGKWRNWDPKVQIPPEKALKPGLAASRPPEKLPTEVTTGAGAVLAPIAAGVAGFSWAEILAASGGVIAGGVAVWLLIGWLRDRRDPELDRAFAKIPLENVEPA